MAVPDFSGTVFLGLSPEPCRNRTAVVNIPAVHRRFYGSGNRWEPTPECSGNRYPIYRWEPGPALAIGEDFGS